MGFAIPAVKVKTTQERKGQSGDSALLEKAMKALADIREIWGLDAPKKAEVTGADGEPFKVYVSVSPVDEV